MLSAPGEGLICKIDVLELEGDAATPIAYKRGKQPDVPEGAYEPERVQVCAQGLILREAGYRSNEGVLYSIESKRRVPVLFDEDLVARTRELVAGLRRMGENQACRRRWSTVPSVRGARWWGSACRTKRICCAANS
jgi:CRISPR-associated protein Cas1